MLASGWAVLNDRENLDLPEFAQATNKAKEAGFVKAAQCALGSQ